MTHRQNDGTSGGSAGSVRSLIVLILLGTNCAAWSAERVQFALPIDCALGSSCFVQNYVDHDPSSGYRDYSCGMQTYDDHNGTDFRIPSMTAQRDGVAVLAAGDGEVAAVRDGVKDVSIRVNGKSSVQGKECGNGVVLRHANGWQTQYCHMAQGSLVVAKGQRVNAGQRLGKVGLSGMTEFPHLHFTVRHNDLVVDPFAPDAKSGQCGADSTLWNETASKASFYRRRIPLNRGFSDQVLSMDDVEDLPKNGLKFSRDSPALVAYVRMIGLEAGDVQRFVLRGANGSILAQNQLNPLDKSKAQTLALIGRKRPKEGWPSGIYQADYSILRDEKVIFEERFSVRLD